eukprot:Hpha_TRINITY_DN13853_c0_g1::TRINITY_DN13853_c0_g1_i1::g.70098::m.70098
MRAFAAALLLAAPAMGCTPPEDFLQRCFQRSGADPNELAYHTVYDGCALTLAVEPCNHELKQLLMGPPGSECDLQSQLPPGMLPDGMSIGDFIDYLDQECRGIQDRVSTEKHILARTVIMQEAARRSARALKSTDFDKPFLRAIGVVREGVCDERKEAFQQCLQPYAQQVITTFEAFAQDVCQVAGIAEPCLRPRRLRQADVCGWESQDSQLLHEVFAGLNEACHNVPPPSMKAMIAQHIAPSSALNLPLMAVLGVMALAFAAYQWAPRSEKGLGLSAEQESYGAV